MQLKEKKTIFSHIFEILFFKMLRKLKTDNDNNIDRQTIFDTQLYILVLLMTTYGKS